MIKETQVMSSAGHGKIDSPVNVSRGPIVSRRRLLLFGGSALLLASCAPAVPTATPAPAKPAASSPVTPAAASTPASPAASTSAPSPAAQSVAATPRSASITVYSGRTEKLIGPIVERFQKETGIEVKARYGDTAEMAAAILEEGPNSPADVYFAQDAGALGAIAAEKRLITLPSNVIGKVDERFRSPTSEWVGISGRARTLIYSTESLQEDSLPDSVTGLTDPNWKGKLGWAPTNGSFQSFVTAMRLLEGDAATRAWLQAIKANGVKDYKNNTAQVRAAGTGEILVGLVNHYYVYSFYKEQGERFPAKNYHPRAGGADAMVNVAGMGILTTSKQREPAEKFVTYMLAKEAQEYFARETFEYPLISDVAAPAGLKPLSAIKTPNLNLGNLADLRGTLKLLQESGVL
jgi:iron(III) transport system substrate-binding protein